MPKITLACYSVRFREPGSPISLDFSNKDAAKLLPFFDAYFKARSRNTVTNTATKKVLSVRSAVANGREINGVLTTGEYGYESELQHVQGKKPKYQRSTQEAEMLPFYFHLYIPEKGKTGILILQRFGLFGVRTILSGDLDSVFQAQFPEYEMNIRPQVPDGVLRELLRAGEVRRIILRKDSIPADICDELDEDIDAQDARMALVISAKTGKAFGKFLSKVRDFVNGRATGAISEIITVEGFEHDRVLMDVELGGRRQIVDLSDFGKLRANIDVTAKVKLGADGHPVFASIETVAKDLLDSLRKTLKV